MKKRKKEKKNGKKGTVLGKKRKREEKKNVTIGKKEEMTMMVKTGIGQGELFWQVFTRVYQKFPRLCVCTIVSCFVVDTIPPYILT